jgi:hypothetical protein
VTGALRIRILLVEDEEDKSRDPRADPDRDAVWLPERVNKDLPLELRQLDLETGTRLDAGRRKNDDGRVGAQVARLHALSKKLGCIGRSCSLT